MKRRRYLGAFGVNVAITAASGCLSSMPGANTDASKKGTVELKNKMDKSVTARVKVSPENKSEEPVLEEEYDLNPNNTKEEIIERKTSKYVVSSSMPNGPVESIFKHKWNVELDSSLTITFNNKGVHFS